MACISSIISIILFFIHDELGGYAQRYIALITGIMPTVMEVCSGLLGLWIAGFVIFVTFSRSSVVVLMAKHEEPETSMNYMRYILSIFFGMVIHFVTLLILACLAYFAFSENGMLMPIMFDHDLWEIILISRVFIHALLPFLITYIIFVFLLVKSFSVGMYKVVTASIEFEIVENLQKEERTRKRLRYMRKRKDYDPGKE